MRLARGRRGQDDQVYSVTSVRRALTDDVHDRMVRYLISMSVRTACVVGIAFTDGWVRWVVAFGAIVLPYVAVVLANAGRERPAPATAVMSPAFDTRLIEAGPQASRPRTARPNPVVLPRGGYLR